MTISSFQVSIPYVRWQKWSWNGSVPELTGKGWQRPNQRERIPSSSTCNVRYHYQSQESQTQTLFLAQWDHRGATATRTQCIRSPTTSYKDRRELRRLRYKISAWRHCRITGTGRRTSAVPNPYVGYAVYMSSIVLRLGVPTRLDKSKFLKDKKVYYHCEKTATGHTSDSYL